MMTTRPMLVLACLTALTACAPPEPEQAQNRHAASVPAAGEGSSVCWSRAQGDALAGRESAFDSATTSLSGRTIKVCYSRPRMRGRTVFGGLVPYGRPWRLGANEATVIHMPAAGTIAGVVVPAGSYSLYAVPDSTEWKIVVNRNAQRWGIPLDGQVVAGNVGTGVVKVEAVSEPVEALTAGFESAGGKETSLIIEWERTRVRVPVRLGSS